jgi:hypothetical protein
MRRFSHILSFLAVALFLLLAGNVAKADSVDPVIGVKGCTSGCTNPWTGSVTLTIPVGVTDFTSPSFDIASGTITSFHFHSGTPLTFTALFPDLGETVTQMGPNDAILSGFTIFPPCENCTDPPFQIIGPFVFEVVGGGHPNGFISAGAGNLDPSGIWT